MHKFLSLFPVFVFVLFLQACGPVSSVGKESVAERLATPAWMVKREIPASPFLLTAYERVHAEGVPAHIYIEGDGKAWLSRSRISGNPTPPNPIALHLAAKDLSENVIYLARPCQYTKMLDPDKKCDSAYWSNKRFAPEVITAFDAALDNIKYRYGVPAFHLTGYSGGAAVAALLASRRSDILSLRTVAGNLDHIAHSQIHGVSYLEGSLNPPDFAANLKMIPQRHYVGGQDKVVPWGVIHSYLKKIGETNCVSYSFIQEAEHADGWVDIWPQLLRDDVTCRGVPRELVFRPIPNKDPKFVPRTGVNAKTMFKSAKP